MSEEQLSSSPFPAVKSIVPLTAGFKDEPKQRKQCILTNYKACQPCCYGSTKHFYRRFQLQKFCSDSSEHFQGYPMLPRRERSIQAEYQSNYTRHSIRPSGSSTGREKLHKTFLRWKCLSLYSNISSNQEIKYNQSFKKLK